MKESIRVENLFFSFETISVLEEISFSVLPGEFIGIFGPNGGGKTTLLNLLMGFLKPSKGKILILDKTPKEARKELSWVPQNFHFDPKFPISVEEVVLGGCFSKLPWYGHFKRQDKENVAQALEKVGLKGFQKRPFSNLSGGQAQRVLIARALVSNPSVLLLDEPTASIDLKAQSEIYGVLNELKGSITILMVTHDLHMAVAQVDRLYCVQKNLTPFSKEKVCEHFALGLYHPILTKEKK